MEIEFQCSEQDYRGFYKLYYKNQLLKHLTILILIPFFVGFLFAGQPFGLVRFIVAIIISVILLVGLFYLIPYLNSIKKLKRSFLNDNGYLDKRKLSFTDEGLYIENASGNGTWKWESMVAINSNPEFISLHFADNKIILIPKKAFVSEIESINFLGIVESKIIQFRGTLKNRSNIDNQKKPSYLYGFLCIIPLIGALLGLAFIILGITKYKDKWFVLIGAFGIVLTIMFYSSLFYAGKNDAVFRKGFIQMSQRELNNLVKEIEFYKMQNGQYPDSLQQLTQENPRIVIIDYIQPDQTDSDNIFEYQREENQYRLFSPGIDGIPNTNDDLYPQVSEKLIGKIGLKKYNIIPLSNEIN